MGAVLGYILTDEADQDGDGVPAPSDCAPLDPAVHPNASEIPGNGIDDDCSPTTSDVVAAPVVQPVRPRPRAVPKFRAAFATRAATHGSRGQLVGIAEVFGASTGSTVNVRCLRGCRLGRTFKPTVKRRGLTLRPTVKLDRRSRIRVTVSRAGRTSRYADYRFLRTGVGLVARRVAGGCATDVRGRRTIGCP